MSDINKFGFWNALVNQTAIDIYLRLSKLLNYDLVFRLLRLQNKLIKWMCLKNNSWIWENQSLEPEIYGIYWLIQDLMETCCWIKIISFRLLETESFLAFYLWLLLWNQMRAAERAAELLRTCFICVNCSVLFCCWF